MSVLLCRSTWFDCKAFISGIIWGWRKNCILMFLRSLTKLLRSPMKCCICLQKFCISLTNFAFTCKSFTFPWEILHYMKWEEKLYFNVFAFSRKAFPPETLHLLANVLHIPTKFCMHLQNFAISMFLHSLANLSCYPQKFCICLQKFSIFPKNLAFSHKKISIPS